MSTNRRDYLDELNDPLRRAVDKVRSEEPPAGAADRSVERTRRHLRAKAVRRPRFRRDLLAVAGIAAAISSRHRAVERFVREDDASDSVPSQSVKSDVVQINLMEHADSRSAMSQRAGLGRERPAINTRP